MITTVNPPGEPKPTWKDNIQMDLQHLLGGGERGLNRSGSG